MALRSSGFTAILISALCCVFAVALQVQTTILQSSTYLGLRINLADLFAPLAGLAILYSLWRGQSAWPRWTMPRTYLWLVALTLVLLAALFNTQFLFGEISRWALVNKFAGWIVLVALFGCGGWIATNARHDQLVLFVRCFLCFAFGVALLDLFPIVLQAFEWGSALVGYDANRYPIHGFMVNRNAYALLYMTCVCLSLGLYFFGSSILPRTYYWALYALMPFFLVFNGSRALFAVLIVLHAAAVLLHRAQKRKIADLGICFVVGTAALVGIYHDKPGEIFFLRGNQFSFAGHLSEVMEDTEGAGGTYQAPKISYPGDSMRLTILSDAKEQIAARPVFGSGLGGALLYQREKHGQSINIIDCTPLWLLVETGALGLLVFAAFYVQALRGLHAGWKAEEGFAQAVRYGILFALAGFTMMCLFHEMMYTRFVWVLLGIGLTQARTRLPE